jgi:hypothetical protein
MQMIAHGGPNPTGMTPAKAAEYVSHNKGNMAPNRLPEKYSKLKKMFRGGKV